MNTAVKQLIEKMAEIGIILKTAASLAQQKRPQQCDNIS